MHRNFDLVEFLLVYLFTLEPRGMLQPGKNEKVDLLLSCVERTSHLLASVEAI